MCRPTKCPTCGNATWMGCGKHVPTAMESAKREDWCTCVSKSGRDVGDYPPAAGDGVSA